MSKIKIINIAIGAVLAALLVSVGIFLYVNLRPSHEKTQLERTFDSWKQTVDENPDSAFARANLAATYLDMGQPEEAIREFQIALDKEPDNPVYMLRLGLAQKQVGNTDGAIDTFKRAAELSPAGEKHEPLYWAGQVSMDKGDKEAAKDFLEQAVKDNDVTWNARYLLGQIYEQEGDNAKAKENYQVAAKFNPTDPDLQEALRRVS